MDNNPTEKRHSYTLLIAALTLAMFTTVTLEMLAQVYLRDMAATFNVSVSVASQIRLLASFLGFVVSLVLGFMAIRFRHKWLIVAGLIVIIIGLIGTSLAPSFAFLQVFYPLDGVGSPIVGVAAIVIIGDMLPLEKKGKAIGIATAMGTLTFLVGIFIGGNIVGVFGSWRYISLVFSLPITILALILVLFLVQSKPQVQQTEITRADYFGKYKKVLTNKSAIGCLAGNFLRVMLPITGAIFGVAFFIETWSLSVNQVVVQIIIPWMVIFFISSWLGGQLLNWGGRRPLTIICTAVEAVFVMSFVNFPSAWGAMALGAVAVFASGIGNTSASCLYLEQIPESRGPMMALSNATRYLGLAAGIAFAAIILSASNYQIMGIVLGSLGFVSVALYYFLAKDPTKDKACT